MLAVAQRNEILKPSNHHHYKSFEQFRQGGSAVLDDLESGCVATLEMKSGNYRIVREQDFQRLISVLEMVSQLQNHLRMVVKVALTATQQPDEVHIQALHAVVETVIESPGVKTVDGHSDLPVEQYEGIDKDEVLLDSEAIYRLMEKR